jgi:hypothetical protein
VAEQTERLRVAQRVRQRRHGRLGLWRASKGPDIEVKTPEGRQISLAGTFR